jgi:WD40 repeat protein/serine/threonine protein kinase
VDASPRKARDVFLATIKLPATEREAYLREACGDDQHLYQRVSALLQAQAEIGSLHEAPAHTVEQPSPETPGTVIGSYKLLEQIGEGGMGTVWMAQQTAPVKRLVAVKFIKAGMDSRQVIARFEAERQALALMDHPNIARVLDAGTTGAGRPYFVMDLVKGVPITRYCDEHRLTPRQRLELFLPVCQALQHAHQKGIIHRDLKPSNVLVALYDGKPVPKVIDFGVAKAAGQALTEKTLVTGFGNIVGTLEYMSPEQAEFNQLDIDTRSDIYSLGVLLYELLTGSTPFSRKELGKSGVLEMLRVIREQEPTRPSTKLSTADGLPALAANRGTEPGKLRRLVKGELDWIVMKALEKDRTRRYETANAFALDVQRYLTDEPVQACPPSVGYRLRKLARRHKTAMTTVAAVLLAALLAVGSLAVSYLRIEESLQHERKAKEDLVQALYYQRIGSAASARANDQAGRAEELLGQCPSELRGWEWHYLKRLPFSDFPVIHQPGVITRIAVSRDGRLLASGNAAGGNSTIKIWDLQKGAELRELKKHVWFIRGLAFSPDGRLLATGDHRNVKIWNPFTGDLLRELPENTRVLSTMTFSADGRFLATACQDDGIRLWDATSWKPIDLIPEKMVAFNGLAFSPNGRRLLTATAEGIVKVHDVSTGQTVSSFRGHAQQAWSAAFSRDHRLVALGSEGGTITVWETDTGKEIHSLEAHTGTVGDLAFLDGGRRLASCGDDRTLKIWDLATGQEALQLGVFAKRVQAFAASADGLRLFYRRSEGTEVEDAIGVADGTPLTSDGTDSRTLVLDGHLHNVVGVAWSPDGRRLASASWDQTGKVWNASTGREQFTLRGHEAPLTDVTFSPDGRLIASASWDETVRLWDAETGQELFILRGERGPAHGVAFHPRDGRVLASAHHDGTIKLWDPTTGQRKSCDVPARQHPVLGVAFSPDGALLAGAAGKNAGNIGVWNAASGAQQHALQRKEVGICFSLAFSPAGRMVAGVATTNEVYLWDLATGEVRGRLRHPLRPNRVAFSPDGRRLATVSLDQAVRLWDVRTNQKPIEVRGHVGDVWCAAFSPDGRRLATGAGYKGRGEIRIRETARWEKKP